MPTACSPRNYASCTSMIGGRLRSVQIPAEGSDSHPFATCVCPIPVSVFHFPFFSLYGSHLFPPKILSHLSLFPRSTFCVPSYFPPFQLSPASSVCPPPPLLVIPSLYPLIFPHYNVRARVWVWKCCKFCKFASLQVSSPLYIIKGTENK